MSWRCSWHKTVFLRRALEFMGPEPAPDPMVRDDEIARLIGIPLNIPAMTLDAAVPGRKDLSVILISIDAMRIDRLGKRTRTGSSITPSVDRLTRQGTLFTQTWSPAPITVFAFNSLMRGRYPQSTDVFSEVRLGQVVPVTERQSTLAASMASSGRPTSAVVGIHPNHLLALDRGFQEFQHARLPARSLSAEQVTNRALKQLPEVAGAPFFLWAHYFDPHAPYEGNGDARYGDHWTQKYDAEITYADTHLGRLLDELESRGLWDTCMVVFLSDHGETWDRAGNAMHSMGVTQDEIHVPLIIRVPGITPRTVDAPVSLVDIYPTIAQLVDAPVPEGLHGTSLLGHILDDSRFVPEYPLFAATFIAESECFAVRDGRWKLTHDARRGFHALFDLQEDPHEEVDLSRDRLENTARLRRVLGTFRSLHYAR